VSRPDLSDRVLRALRRGSGVALVRRATGSPRCRARNCPGTVATPGPSTTPLQPELLGVHPLVLQQRPPVDGQPLENILVRQPPVTTVAPILAPRVPDEECPSGRGAGSRVLDLHAVVVAHRHHRVAAQGYVAGAREGHAAQRLRLLDAPVGSETEHRGQSRGDEPLDPLEQHSPLGARRVEAEVL